MGESDTMLVRLGLLLAQIARPHRCGELVPADVQASLWQLGVSCDAATPRTDLVAQLWVRKRAMRQRTPSSAA